MTFNITAEQMGYQSDWKENIPEGYEIDGVAYPYQEPDSLFLGNLPPYVFAGENFFPKGSLRIRLRKLFTEEQKQISMVYNGCTSIEEAVAKAESLCPIPNSEYVWKEVEKGDVFLANDFGSWIKEEHNPPLHWGFRVVAKPRQEEFLMIPLKSVNLVIARYDGENGLPIEKLVYNKTKNRGTVLDGGVEIILK